MSTSRRALRVLAAGVAAALAVACAAERSTRAAGEAVSAMSERVADGVAGPSDLGPVCRELARRAASAEVGRRLGREGSGEVALDQYAAGGCPASAVPGILWGAAHEVRQAAGRV